MPITWTITRRDLRSFTTAGGSVTFSVSVGARGPKGDDGTDGDDGVPGPNSIDDDTALGLLTHIADPAFLLVGNAAGDRARKLTPTGWGLSNLLVSVPAGRVPFSDANGLVTSNAGLVFGTGSGLALSGVGNIASSGVRVGVGGSGTNALEARHGFLSVARVSVGTASNGHFSLGSLGSFRFWGNADLATGSTFDTEATRVSPGFVGLGSPTNKVSVGHDGLFGRITNPDSTNGFFFHDANGPYTYFARGGIRTSVGCVISVTPNDGNTAADTTLSRNSPGVWQMGTTTSNALGSLLLTNLTASGEINTGSNYYAVRTLRLGAPNDSQPCIYVRNNLGSSYFANGTVACIAFRPNPQAATTPAIADLQFGNSNTSANPRMVLNHNQITGYTAILNADTTVNGSLTLSGRLGFATSDTAPANTTTPLLWMNVLVGGITYKMPLYQ